MTLKHPNLKQYLQTDSPPTTKQPAFLDHLFGKIDYHTEQGGRTILITLTKKSAEEVTNFLISKGYKAYYLHSEISTLDRREIIKKLKTGVIDIIVGINLLREGIDLPEVSFIGILDADKEGFLRSTTALVQIIGRAARNPRGEVVLYADNMTESMTRSLRETYRRRDIQIAHNTAHNITPSVAISNVKNIQSVKTDEELAQEFTSLSRGKVKRLKRMTKKEKSIIAADLRKQLDEAIKSREFELAAKIRDQLKDLEEN